MPTRLWLQVEVFDFNDGVVVVKEVDVPPPTTTRVDGPYEMWSVNIDGQGAVGKYQVAAEVEGVRLNTGGVRSFLAVPLCVSH